uniref:THH1/TOM1/TOM3 domain-containing protein n=1 Tax=Spongospora subterranea TaxID=70186 RepID=A0A0H5QK10_9EUKA|eukprot:CRZ02328.1 hypothetical protein [Spongospora subterranea]
MSAGLIFWAIMTIIHIPILIGPVIYWRCRKYNPMKNRRPVLFTFCFVFLSLEVYVQIIIAGAWDFIGVWVDVFVGSGVMICVLEGYLIFTLSLYISYNKSKDQLAIFNMSPSQNSIKELQSFMKSVKRLNYLLGDQFAFIWIISNVTVIEIIAVVAALPDSSKLNYSMKEYNSSGDGSFRSIQNVVLGRCLITALALLVVSWRLRIVNDAFKTKSMLKRVGLGTFLGIAFFEATAYYSCLLLDSNV